MFSVINPNYKFVAKYNPTEEDKNNPYNIDIKVVENFSENEKAIAKANGQVHNYSEKIEGLESYNNYIEFTGDCLDSPEAFMGTFKHEFLHLLGRGDAYNKDVNKDTIMDGGQKFGASIYSKHSALQTLDVACLDMAYRSIDNQFSDEYIQNFIDNYEKNNQYTYENYVASKDFEIYRNLISEIDMEGLIEDIKNSGYNEKYKNEIIKTLQDSSVINKNLGNSQGSLGECLKDENNYTYMTWDEDGRIKIARKSDFGGSTTSRQMKENRGIITIGDEYSGKLLFGVGDYVFSYDYQKDYFDEKKVSISENFKNVYKLTQLTQEQYFETIQNLHNDNSLEQE